MRNEHVNQQLSAYVAGELPADASRLIAEHLIGCARCRRDYEEIKVGVRLASMLAPVPAPSDLWEQISRRLDAPLKNKKNWLSESSSWLSLPWPRLIAAGVATACLILGLSWYYSRPTVNRPEIAILPTPLPSSSPGIENPPVVPSPSSTRRPQQLALRPPSASAAGMEVVSLAGRPTVDTREIDDRGRIGVGEWLETDPAARARISIAEIGRVEVEPNSRIGLIGTSRTEHRLKLQRGRMQASIYAPPRIFIVETPAATAIDLGCEYTLDVDESGAAHLHVTSGFVAMVDGNREVIVPAGAICQTQPGRGTGTPYFEDATAVFRQALGRFDAKKNWEETLPMMLSEARRRDTLTLWHLLQIAPETERRQICDRMIELYAPPEGVTREGLIGLDSAMLQVYRKRLEWVW